jgi:hypothetical protein
MGDSLLARLPAGHRRRAGARLPGVAARDPMPPPMAKRKQGKSKPKHRRSGPPLAESADRYALYQRAVQSPDVDAAFLDHVYRETRGRAPRVLREDFCGTFAVCCEWAKLGAEREAWGVDLDPEPLAWGRAHNLAQLDPSEQARVRLEQGDVRTVETPAADVIAAENFSYFTFKTRDALRGYLKRTLRGLDHHGLLVLDLFGGYESYEDDREEITEHDGFDYVWDQAKFDPITHDATFHIHFRFPDKSRLQEAFTYQWRMWSIPEIRELVLEAGYARADVYWEGTDSDTGEGTGVYEKAEHGDADPSWNAYVIGVK